MVQLWQMHPNLGEIDSPPRLLRYFIKLHTRKYLSRCHTVVSLDKPLSQDVEDTLLDVEDLRPDALSVEDEAIVHQDLVAVSQHLRQWPLVKQVIFKMSVAGYGYADIHRYVAAKHGYHGTVKAVAETLLRARHELRRDLQVQKLQLKRMRLSRKASWSAYHAACVQCGTTEQRHAANGWCLRCYSAKRHKDIKLRIHTPREAIQQWSRKHTACLGCGTTTTAHMGHGYCKQCYHVRFGRGRTTMRRTRGTLVKLYT